MTVRVRFTKSSSSLSMREFYHVVGGSPFFDGEGTFFCEVEEVTYVIEGAVGQVVPGGVDGLRGHTGIGVL